jgi:hypothetical protein
MTQTLHSDNTDTRHVHRQFLDLILADDQLVQAEFDAIVASEWDFAPPSAPADSAIRERPPGGCPCSRPVSGAPRTPARPPRPGMGEWSRQRSPPLR